MHGFDIAVDYDGCIGAVALRDAGVSTIKVGPKYILRTGKVNLSAGVDYAYLHDAIYRDRNYLFPAVDLRLDVVQGVFHSISYGRWRSGFGVFLLSLSA